MFRKIVSNLAFSPALVGQLSFYAKRLRKEEITRRLGLVFTIMALVVQSLAVFSPPEAANASSSADFVRGGVSSVQDFLKYYDSNSNHIKDIYNSLGIKRAEIASAKPTVIGEDSRYNWSMTSLYSYADGQRSWNYGGGNVFYRPMRLTQQGGNRHEVYYAHSDSIGWFAIKKDCGNLVTETPPNPKEPEAACVNLNVAAFAGNPNKFHVKGKARADNGATISTYVYRVFDASGKRVDEVRSNNSKEQDASVYDHKAGPGTYTVRLIIVTSEGNERDRNCVDTFSIPKPATPEAICRSVNAAVQNRTIVSLTGSAKTENGAKVSKYTFVVKDSSGKVVKTVAVNSAKEAVAAPSFALTKPGSYSVQLTVTTSLGEKTNTNTCVKQFKIVEEAKCPLNPSLPANSPDCQPCPESPDVWIKDEKCTAEIINTKKATNISQGSIDASTKLARASDKISYTLSVTNQGLTSTKVDFKEELSDVLEYATLIDNGGGTFDKETNTLSWPAVAVAKGQTQSRTFVVQMLPEIPLTNTGKSDEAKYDCKMVNTFGNTVSIGVECPIEKEIVENTVEELPKTGPGENILFGGSLFSIVTYFYARSRQLGKEVRLIRKNVNAGAL